MSFKLGQNFILQKGHWQAIFRQTGRPREADKSTAVLAAWFRKTNTSWMRQEKAVFLCHLIGQSTLFFFSFFFWSGGWVGEELGISKANSATISKQGLGWIFLWKFWQSPQSFLSRALLFRLLSTKEALISRQNEIQSWIDSKSAALFWSGIPPLLVVLCGITLNLL